MNGEAIRFDRQPQRRDILRAKLLNAILGLSILTVGAVATASAQLPGTRMSVQIPFEFTVGDKLLPAGDYEVRRIGNDSQVLLIQNVDDRGNTAIFMTSRIDEVNSIRNSELVFHHYGDIYFLAEVSSRYEGITRELEPSKQERRMKRDLASNNKEPRAESVTLVAN